MSRLQGIGNVSTLPTGLQRTARRKTSALQDKFSFHDLKGQMFIPLPDISSLQSKHLVCQNYSCKAEIILLATDNRIGKRCSCGGMLVPALVGTALMAASALRVLQEAKA